LCTKQLIFELMGKYSNIIFASSDDMIIDSIKRVPSTVSSIREVLPGRRYEFPQELMERDILTEDVIAFSEVIRGSSDSIMRTLYINYAGISPLMSQEICCRAGIDADLPSDSLNDDQINDLYNEIKVLVDRIKCGNFEPTLISRKEEPVDFAGVRTKLYESDDYEQTGYESISKLLEFFYAAKDSRTRIRQKSADLRKIVTNALERSTKKYDLQEKQLKDCGAKEKFKVYGDLLNTYGYSIRVGNKSFTCRNFYDGDKEITIPLDEHKTGIENAKKYFDKYSKLRRTEDALGDEILRTKADIDHLTSVLQSLDMSTSEADLAQIRVELEEFGYVKRRDRINDKHGKAKQPKSDPMHFKSHGYDLYVGKNNYQNEELAFRVAGPEDWWFHAKGVPGSHVIVKTDNSNGEVPDEVFEDAASLAAFYSKNSTNEKVEVDYTRRKNLRRVTGAAPGFVIYHTNYSMVASPKQTIEGSN